MKGESGSKMIPVACSVVLIHDEWYKRGDKSYPWRVEIYPPGQIRTMIYSAPFTSYKAAKADYDRIMSE